MKKCPVQSGTLWAQTVTSRMGQFQGLWTHKPSSVSLDFTISSDACRVYDILCIENYKSNFRTNLVSVTTRGLAELTGKSRTTVSRWLKELCDNNHLEKISGHGQALVYRILSPVYDYKVRVETGPNEAHETTSRELPSIRTGKRAVCPKCKKPAKITSTSGVCGKCLEAWAAKTA